MSDIKRICLVSSQYLPHVGGVENYVYNLSRELARRGHSVTIVTSLADGTREYEREGNIEIFRLPSLQLMNGRFPVLKKSKTLKRVSRELSERNFDLMIVNMRFFFISLWAVKLARRLGVRCIMLDHGSSHLNTGGKLTSKLGELFEHWITWREKRYCKTFAGVSKESLGWLRHFGIESDVLLCNAVDLETFEKYRDEPVRDFRREYGIPEGATVITFVGRLTVEKGIEQLVNAVRRINEERDDVYLLAAGGGYLLERLERVKSKNTYFVGQVSTPEVASLLAAGDIFCLPSFSEGFPTCVIEACVAHNYIITTYRGDAKEIVTDREHGIILPDNNEDGVYEALLGVLDDPEHRRAAAELCYSTVVNNYTWRHTADAIINLIG
ncbi:MAG: glycosyltransferase family 4 protein [Clostridia bacterium]|nr:glycosyltransferase family 4 protein [Clostridia bacterium]